MSGARLQLHYRTRRLLAAGHRHRVLRESNQERNGLGPYDRLCQSCLDLFAYLEKEQGAIVGAMAVTMYHGEDYHAIEWDRKVQDDEAAVIHILAVNPDKQGTGIGFEMVLAAIDLAKANGMKSVRLDALASNTPAHKLYGRLGFEYRGKQHLYADNTGWTDSFFFELSSYYFDNYGI